MKHFYLFISVMLFGLWSVNLQAQTPFHYSCGFESTTDTAGWTIMNDGTSGNSWIIGSAIKRTGSKSLYISNNGSTADYNKTVASMVIAYYTVTLPLGVDHAVSFDWLSNGEAGLDELSICVVDDPTEVITAGSGGVYPAWHTSSVVNTISGQRGWQTYAVSLVGTGQPQRIVFVWKNDANSLGTAPGGGVDNFYIRETTPLNYFNGWDDPVENAKWTLRGHNNCVNKWAIGGADYNVGPSALYISPDTGKTASYVNREGWVTATRTFILPPNVQCDISFDWKCYGEFEMDFAYVCWVTDSTETVGTNANTSLPTWVNSAAQSVNLDITGGKQMVRSSTWKTGTFQQMGTGRPARLVFIWKNNSSMVYEPSIVIDNLEITTRDCAKPENFSASLYGTTATLTWDGTGSNYEVWYRNTYEDQNEGFTVLTGQTSPCQITDLEKGRYTFWVRQVCDTTDKGTSAWSKIHNFLVITNEGCINFIDLTGSHVLATTGTTANPYAVTGVVDYGQFSQSSRHTVNTINDRDPETNYGLTMIPDGSLASVRLGNWRSGGEAESLTYTFTVDSSSTILLMKYAVILEDPEHPESQQPFFQLQILNENNGVIDATCGDATFIPGTNTSDWNVNGIIRWKDWTLVGLNLQSYVGRTVKVRLTTKDCSQSGHYGYAYFTLDCAKGSLEGLSCGDATPDSVCAPEGFFYRWTKKNDPYTVISLDRCFRPSVGDTTEYNCRVIYPTNPACGFDLSAVLVPRWPLAKATYKWQPEDCKNIIKFTNQSVVTTAGGVLQGEKADIYYWDFGNGKKSQKEHPEMDFGPDGGIFNVTMVASMAKDECLDTFRMQVLVPKIESYHTKRTERICVGGKINFNGKDYTEEGVYMDTLVSFAGCDSIMELSLFVSDLFEQNDTITICEGEQYQFGAQVLTASGEYQNKFQTTAGCDSVVNLKLNVNPIMKIQWEPMTEICEDDPLFNISYQSNGSEPTKYSLVFKGEAVGQGFINQEDQELSTNTIQINLPSGVKAGIYEAEINFVDEKFDCGEYNVPMRFVVNYSKTVIKQLWNDVLGLKNMLYNGGYDFVSYQWYCDGNQIEGATAANYYVSGGELNFDSYYQARIIRADGVELYTCPFRPTRLPDEINVTPITIVNQQFVVSAPVYGNVQVYNTSGLLMMTYNIVDGENELRAPSYPGVYLVRVNLDNGLQKTSRLVVVSQ